MTKEVTSSEASFNKKMSKIIEEHLIRYETARGLLAPGGDQMTAILIKKAKIAVNHTVKWKRNAVEAPRHTDQLKISRASIGNTMTRGC